MKMILFITLVACIQSWGKGHSQGISLSLKNTKLEKVFLLIREQTNYRFLYTNEQLDGTKPVTLELRSATIDETMKACLANQPLEWSLQDNHVIIRKKEITTPGNIPVPFQDIRGKVTGPGGELLAGATISIKGSSKTVVSNEKGEFSIDGVLPGTVLIISSLGHQPVEFTVKNTDFFTVQLKPLVAELQDIKISTGYQELSKERATGSFEKVNNELFNRVVTPNVLERLDGVVPGLIFNRRIGTANSTDISIRGISTINSDQRPLIVLDNFPYEGNINNINPNDIESITVLKDAAAASIWGTKAGNGVIVITTKKAKFNQPLRVSLNNNITIANKPDLNYVEQFTPAAFIEIEQFLFSKGFFNGQLNSTSFPVVSPVVEILDKRRSGLITAADSASQINELLKNNILDDYSKYLYRKAVNLQHSITLSGGSNNANYLLSVGYDKNLNTQRGNQLDRITINTNTRIRPIKKLEIEIGALITQVKRENNSPGAFILAGGGKGRLFPYAKLADDKGNPLATVKDYRSAFTDTVSGLVDWKYRPLDELRTSDNRTRSFDILFNTGVKYELFSWLSTEIKYQFEKTFGSTHVYYSPETYYTRSLVNIYTPKGLTTANSAVPPGGILDRGNSDLTAHAIRGQVNFTKSIGAKHEVSAIAGGEVRRSTIAIESSRIYGYSDKVLTNQPVNFTVPYLTYFGYEQPLLNNVSMGENANRSISAYANAAYTFDQRYTISGSARRDGSNLFGTKTNNKWQPLWSAGMGWNISNESFYRSSLLPYLQLKATHGHSGNVNNSTPALLTLQGTRPNSFNGLPTNVVYNPPNPSLRWEDMTMINLAVNFGAKNNRLSGTLEYYWKKSIDLIGYVPADQTLGFFNYTANSATLNGKGLDINIRSLNLNLKSFSWSTNWLFSYNKNKVVKYLLQSLLRDYLNSPITPIVGEHAYSLISYRWAGLDPANGDPQGYVNGQLSKDYRSIVNSEKSVDYIIHGSTRPLYFGSIRNTFTLRSFSLTINMTYRFKYFFRKTNAIDYNTLFSSWNQNGFADYLNRWQKPGDEVFTNVPSMPYPLNLRRDNFYRQSEATVERGDHIRLQDIAFNYTMDKSVWKKLPASAIRLYGNVNNLGMIWKKNNAGLDPDYGTPLPVGFSIGANIDF